MKGKINEAIGNILFSQDLKIKTVHILIDSIFYYSNIISFIILLVLIYQQQDMVTFFIILGFLIIHKFFSINNIYRYKNQRNEDPMNQYAHELSLEFSPLLILFYMDPIFHFKLLYENVDRQYDKNTESYYFSTKLYFLILDVSTQFFIIFFPDYHQNVSILACVFVLIVNSSWNMLNYCYIWGTTQQLRFCEQINEKKLLKFMDDQLINEHDNNNKNKDSQFYQKNKYQQSQQSNHYQLLSLFKSPYWLKSFIFDQENFLKNNKLNNISNQILKNIDKLAKNMVRSIQFDKDYLKNKELLKFDNSYKVYIFFLILLENICKTIGIGLLTELYNYIWLSIYLVITGFLLTYIGYKQLLKHDDKESQELLMQQQNDNQLVSDQVEKVYKILCAIFFFGVIIPLIFLWSIFKFGFYFREEDVLFMSNMQKDKLNSCLIFLYRSIEILIFFYLFKIQEYQLSDFLIPFLVAYFILGSINIIFNFAYIFQQGYSFIQDRQDRKKGRGNVQLETQMAFRNQKGIYIIFINQENTIVSQEFLTNMKNNV